MRNISLIIGGTSGIGLETAKYLLGKDYEVLICGRRSINIKNINSLEVDIRSEKSVKSLFKTINNMNGEINSLIYSTGVTSEKNSITEFDEKKFNDVISTNVTGILLLLKYFFPVLRKNKAKIAVINSIAGRNFSQLSGIEYTVSKAALSGLVRQLAIEWSKYGIFINSVFPSTTLTPMLKKNINNKAISKLIKNIPLQKLADPFDTARAVEFLISNDNKYITGAGIDVSGGQFLSA